MFLILVVAVIVLCLVVAQIVAKQENAEKQEAKKREAERLKAAKDKIVAAENVQPPQQAALHEEAQSPRTRMPYNHQTNKRWPDSFYCDLYDNEQEETQKFLRELKILKVVGGQTVDLQFEGEAPEFKVTIDGNYVGKTCDEDGTLLDENWDDFTLKNFYVRGGGTAEDGSKRPYVFSLQFETKPGVSPLKLSEIELPLCKIRRLTTGDEVVFLSSTKKIHRSALWSGCGVGPAGCQTMLYEEAKAAGGIECAKCFR